MVVSDVTEKLKGVVNNNSSSATGLALAHSLEQMNAVFTSCLQECKDRQVFTNASQPLKYKYKSLVLTIRIKQLEQEAQKVLEPTKLLSMNALRKQLVCRC